MKKKISYLLLIISFLFTSTLPASSQTLTGSIYNVKTFGAKGDRKTIDTHAINSTIDKANKAGGGTVYVPSGNYLIGSIHLKSNICLYLDQGATLIAASIAEGGVYDAAEQTVNTTYQDFGHSHFHNSLLWGEDIHDVTIMGTGKIWGRGLINDYKKDAKEGNKAIVFYKCRNIIIKDISVLHGGWFAILATGADNLTITNVKLDTNRDGMDIDCCKNVRVTDCYVNSPYDDGICLKSTFALGYARTTQNVTITGCQVSGYDEGTLLDGTYKRLTLPFGGHPTGRIKFGTESNGGFQNVAVSNCVFDYCRGLALETVDGALLEDVVISNITMRDVVNDPIFLRLGARMRGPQGTPVGKLRRVIISNINVWNANPDYTSTIIGLPGNNIEDIELDNIHINYKGGGKAGDITKAIPENENHYPEPGMFGSIPAYGFFIRHAQNIRMNNIELTYQDKDVRPAFLLDDVKGIRLFHVTAQKEDGTNAFQLKQVSGFAIRDSEVLKDTDITGTTTTGL